MMGALLKSFFGGGRNVVAETAGIFHAGAEASAGRAHELDSAVLEQLAAEFGQRRRGGFDRLMDGVNRLPRPLLVAGIVWMLVETARTPERMAEVFAAWAVLPEAAWVVFGIVVTFYFGGRAQLKDQEFQRGLVGAAAAASGLAARGVRPEDTGDPDSEDMTGQGSGGDNPALADWRAG